MLKGLFVFALLATAPVMAQVQQSGIDGSVRDESGAPLPGVTIELRNPETNYTRVATTDVAGRYRAANLPPGMYMLTAGLSGFTSSRQPVALTIGETAHVNVALHLQAMQETVDVIAAPSGIDTTALVPITVVDTERIEELPVQTRNYLDFVLLAPGVVSTAGRGRSGGGAAASDSGFSFAGQRPRSNVLTIDGLNNNDEYSGAARTELSLETVKEFDVVSHGNSAETGGGSGASINVVTKSGANTMHGDAFVFKQDGRLDARPFDGRGTTPPLQRYRTGGAVGGPIVRDRTFYYVAGEYESAHGAAASGLDDATKNALNAALLRLGHGSARLLTPGFFPTGRRETELSGKVSHQLTPATNLVGRVTANDNRERGDAFNSTTLADRSARGGMQTKDVAVTMSGTSVVGNQATNEVRSQVAERSTATDGNSNDAGIIIAGVAELGHPYDVTGKERQRYVELGDTVASGRGNHLFRFGGDVTRIGVTGRIADGTHGVYLFRSIEAFAAGAADSYRQMFGDSRSHIGAARYDAFAQDDWTRGKLTVSGGLRFDGERLPRRLEVTNRQLQPRFGLVWAPQPDWVLRATAGVFADRIPLVAIERPLVADGSQAFEQIVDGPAAATVFSTTQGGSLTAPPVTVPRSRYIARSGNWTPSSRQFSIGTEHAFSQYLSASVTLLRADGRHLLRTVNTSPAPRLDGDVFELQPTASSTHTGCTVTVNRRMADDIEWSASYTLSKAADDASDFDEQPANPSNLAAERAPSIFDQRHRLTASALFEIGDKDEPNAGPERWWTELLRHIEVAPIIAIASGGRANPLTGVDTTATHAYPLNERPAGYARNSLRLPATAVVNLRVVKYIPLRSRGRLDFVVEAFNLLNRRNVEQVGTYRGLDAMPPATFGRPIRTGDARQLQVSLDAEF